MSYRIVNPELVKVQAERVLGFITMETIKHGGVSAADILKEFDIPTALMVQIRTHLLATGRVEEFQ